MSSVELQLISVFLKDSIKLWNCTASPSFHAWSCGHHLVCAHHGHVVFSHPCAQTLSLDDRWPHGTVCCVGSLHCLSTALSLYVIHANRGWKVPFLAFFSPIVTHFVPSGIFLSYFSATDPPHTRTPTPTHKHTSTHLVCYCKLQNKKNKGFTLAVQAAQKSGHLQIKLCKQKNSIHPYVHTC